MVNLSTRKKKRLQEMIEEIDQIIAKIREKENEFEKIINTVHPRFKESAKNLVHYRTLRTLDIRELQKSLGNRGLTRLAKSEAHLLSSLTMVRNLLNAFLKEKPVKFKKTSLSIKKSNRVLKSNAKALLGYRSKGRQTRIMVTIPSTAATDYQMVKELVAGGMNCARINCAHDSPEIWAAMIENIRKAAKKHQRNVKIAMDLAGPKIRTGTMQPGPRVMKFSPQRNERGEVIHPATLWLGPDHQENDIGYHIPLRREDLDRLQIDQRLFIWDTRSKKRELQIVAKEKGGCWAYCFEPTYLEANHRLYFDLNNETEYIEIGDLPPIEQRILLKMGDTLIIHKSPEPGEPALYDVNGNLLANAHISCTSHEIFDHVEEGDPILFDDGKIAARISKKDQDVLHVEIVRTKHNGGKLRAHKGINLPDSKLKIQGLTQKDREDLGFVAENADVVSMSFINDVQDVRDLLNALKKLGKKDKLGIILKIETKSSYKQLPQILLEAMKTYPVGVMIARGDLAIEAGWKNIGRVQEEILSLCQAAHIPQIWATQVLENLAKKGIPARAEITDSVMAQRADCVMLNKGEYIVRAITLLDTILKDMDPYQDKRTPMLPPMKITF